MIIAYLSKKIVQLLFFSCMRSYGSRRDTKKCAKKNFIFIIKFKIIISHILTTALLDELLFERLSLGKVFVHVVMLSLLSP